MKKLIEAPFLPFKVNVYLTNHCNYSCEYRFLKEQNILNTEFINKEMLKKIIFYLNKYSVPLVSICGGDPLISEYYIDFVKELMQNKNYVVTATNAVNLEKDFFLQLKEIGIKYLQIGVDSIRNEKKYNYKENGHLNKVLTSIKILKEIGIKYGMGVCITKDNIKDFDELLLFALKNKFELLKIAFYNGENPKFKLSNTEIDNFLKKVIKYNLQYNNYIKSSLLPKTLHYVSEFPTITLGTNGDILIEENNLKIGNIMNDDPGIMYIKYLNSRRNENEI